MEIKNYLKRDLIKVVVLTVVFSGVLFGLEIIDDQGGDITEIAGKITSFFIK